VRTSTRATWTLVVEDVGLILDGTGHNRRALQLNDFCVGSIIYV
jgi:hypothetical protein